MGLSRLPHLASIAFVAVASLGVAALAWSATHDGSSKHGYGSASQQAAARRTLAVGLALPPGLAVDQTFTACGEAGDACLTGTGDTAATYTQVAASLHAIGGHLGACASSGPLPLGVIQRLPVATCSAEAHLHGAWVRVDLGDGWELPGKTKPRTAVWMIVETTPADQGPLPHAALPSTAPSIAALVPSTWTVIAHSCVGGLCPAHMVSVSASAPETLAVSEKALASAALAAGYRVDGRPCVNNPGSTGCEIEAERWHGGNPGAVHTLLDATLVPDSEGDVTATLTLTDLS
jgi:hypothetical protein